MKYIKIDNCNMNNGPGLRVVLWVSGCSHHCQDCFNPETWDENNGDKWTKKQQQLIIKALSEDWCSGITLTGGDPFYISNRKDITSLCKVIKEIYPEKTIWVYTGYLFDELISEECLNYIDVLIDGEFKKENKSPDAYWIGSSNQRVIDVQKTLEFRKTNPDSKEVILYAE